MWLLLIVIAIILVTIVFTRETRTNESYALPFSNIHSMQVARMEPSKCTDDCIIRTRQGTFIDGACADMCKQQNPSTIDVMADCGHAWGGYANKKCTYDQDYPKELKKSLEGNMGLNKYSQIQ